MHSERECHPDHIMFALGEWCKRKVNNTRWIICIQLYILLTGNTWFWLGRNLFSSCFPTATTRWIIYKSVLVYICRKIHPSTVCSVEFKMVVVLLWIVGAARSVECCFFIPFLFQLNFNYLTCQLNFFWYETTTCHIMFDNNCIIIIYKH